MHDYDIIIVGAGLSGLSLAACLQNQPIKIAILEDHLPGVLQGQKDLRPISLSHTSQQLLQTLGLWPELSFSASPIQTVHISDQGHFGAVRIRAEEFAVSALGYVVPYCELQKVCYQFVAALPNVDIISIESLDAMQRNEQLTRLAVTINNESQFLTTPLVVGADGAHSTVRDLASIDYSEKETDLIALTAKLNISRPDLGVAYERFSKLGTLAILPGQGHDCGLVWTMSSAQFAEIDDLTEAELIARVQSVFAYRLGRIQSFAKNGSYKLQNISSQTQQLPGVVLIGHAAHTFLPLAAQGLNLSLRDIALLAELYVSGDVDCYQDKRLRDQKNIQRLTAFASTWQQMPLLKSVKSFGLLATELLPSLQQFVGKLGIGHSGYVPKLMRDIALCTM